MQGAVFSGTQLQLNHRNVALTIADRILRLLYICPEYHDQKTHSSFDLGKVWHDATKTSFIFAVVATRNDAFARSPQEVMDFHRLLEDSFQWSLQNREVIFEAAAKKMSCSKELVRRYYSTIEYRLLPKHFHGLDHFAGLEG